jgi:hypothetical protein
VPIKQREVLEYVGQVEAAMVKGFPFEVPKEYASRPLLKVRGRAWGRACSQPLGGTSTPVTAWGLACSETVGTATPVTVCLRPAANARRARVVVAYHGARARAIEQRTRAAGAACCARPLPVRTPPWHTTHHTPHTTHHTPQTARAPHAPCRAARRSR